MTINAINSKVSVFGFTNLLDMIFSDDAILMSLLERYDEENEIKEAVLSYCNRGAVSSSTQKRSELPPQKLNFM